MSYTLHSTSKKYNFPIGVYKDGKGSVFINSNLENNYIANSQKVDLPPT
ncbi:hypothetical protein MOO46_06370 [Apilactobacillus apisilvae]|uniref:Uncharacterized protein n=1 Tax=Apilactobacillus apisilvae TaxID=2923364 RepID=A0ABY4PGY5_9LACO|nr:hypothetical protein [Apilactobacillus apisilvae]UQS84862.1 hypothetical protein MOO46_06370 [Apilactobacillus apisilvae]